MQQIGIGMMGYQAGSQMQMRLILVHIIVDTDRVLKSRAPQRNHRIERGIQAPGNYLNGN